MSDAKKIAMRISGGQLPKGYSIVINLEIDFTGCTREDLITWASSDRRIACQRWLRGKSPEFLEKLQKEGLKIPASEAGQELRSREDRVDELVKMGIGKRLAEQLVDNPQELEKIVNKD